MLRGRETTPGTFPTPSQAAAVGIRGTAGVVEIPGAERIVDRVMRERIAVTAVGVTGRIRIIRVRAQLAAIVSLLVVKPRRVCPAVVPMYEYKTRPHCFSFSCGSHTPYDSRLHVETGYHDVPGGGSNRPVS